MAIERYTLFDAEVAISVLTTRVTNLEKGQSTVSPASAELADAEARAAFLESRVEDMQKTNDVLSGRLTRLCRGLGFRYRDDEDMFVAVVEYAEQHKARVREASEYLADASKKLREL